MQEGKVRKLAVLLGLGVLAGLLLKKLRGEPAPQFSNHPTVTGGPAVDPLLSPRPEIETEPAAAAQPELDLEPLVPAPEDPTVAADAATALVAADVDPTVPGAEPVATGAPVAVGDQIWVEPVDGTCPEGYPVKAKVKSGIFHQPGGLAYERTNPDRCYPDAASAEADGLRAAKR